MLFFMLLKKIFSKNKSTNKNSNKKANQINVLYKTKTNFLTHNEISYFNVIKNVLKNTDYIIFPQIPLSQIVVKKQQNSYRSELFRIIDFCIFNKDYSPIVCIEINDNSHYAKKRHLRDEKVKAILQDANLPLITFWTEYGVNNDYIEKRVYESLNIKSVG